jgi:hypothetical protein
LTQKQSFAAKGAAGKCPSAQTANGMDSHAFFAILVIFLLQKVFDHNLETFRFCLPGTHPLPFTFQLPIHL